MAGKDNMPSHSKKHLANPILLLIWSCCILCLARMQKLHLMKPILLVLVQDCTKLEWVIGAHGLTTSATRLFLSFVAKVSLLGHTLSSVLPLSVDPVVVSLKRRTPSTSVPDIATKVWTDQSFSKLISISPGLWSHSCWSCRAVTNTSSGFVDTVASSFFPLHSFPAFKAGCIG
jgi:hypothetical protein